MNIVITNLQSNISIPIPKIKFVVRLVCRKLKFKSSDLSIVFVGEKRMRRLNREYLGHDYVTDVLTFGKRGHPRVSPFYSEIVVCPAVAKRNAKHHDNPVQREIILYVVHGILHLCGYDDHKPEDVERMRQKEQQIMDML